MTPASLVVMALYAGALVLLGVIAHGRRQPTGEDYYLAGRDLGKWLLVGTVVATIVNGLAVTGTPALFYEGGVLFGQLFVAVFGCMAFLWRFGPRVNELGRHRDYLTQGQMYGDHFQSRPILFLTASMGILSLFPFLAIQLVAIGKVLDVTTRGQIAVEEGVVICAVTVGVYIFLGGARAAVWTDALQGLIAFALFLIGAALFVHWVGGLPSAIGTLSETMPEKLTFNRINTPLFIDGVLSWTFAFFLWPHVFQRIFMARTPESLRSTAAVSSILFGVLGVAILIMAIAATAELHGSLKDSDELFAVMLNRHLPIGGALLAIVVFCLGMSTIDSMLLSLSSIANRDIWEGFRNADHGQREYTRGRWSTLGFLTLAACFSITAIGRGAIIPWVTLGASVATLLLWPFLGMFVWKRSASTIIGAMALGFAAICAVRFTELGDALPFGFATAGFLTGALVFAFGGLYSTHEPGDADELVARS